MTSTAEPRCIHEMVADQVARTPDLVAVSHRGRELTYRELGLAAAALADRLRAAGVAGGGVVAVVLDRTPELIVALTAVLRAGGAYLYLDPAEPAAQRERVLRDPRPGVGVVGEGCAEHVPGVPVVVQVPPDATTLASPPGGAAAPGRPVHPDAPAYVCYTSGSTGEPKGVVVPHRSVWRLVDEPDWIDVRPD